MIELDERFKGHYEDWQRVRIAAITKQFGLEFFDNKTLLEVGAGFADIGAAFAQTTSCKVTATDAVKDYVDMMTTRYGHLLTAQVFDLDSCEWPFENTFDIVFHMGVLYHQQSSVLEQSLKMILENTNYIVLETEVVDSDDPYKILDVIENFGWDQSFHEKGSRPSIACVSRILTEAEFEFEIVSDERWNSSFHSYNWQAVNDGSHQDGKRRCWFGKRKGLV